MKRILSVLALAVALVGCGSTEDGSGAPGDRSQYPAGPYGKTEGSVIANLEFQKADGSPFSLRDVQADEKNRVLLVTTTAGWCTACREEQPKLKQLHSEYAGRGLVIVAAMFEDNDFEKATLAHVQGWQEQYQLPFPVVLDANFQFGAYYDRQLTPMNMIVDVDTMEILQISTGFDEQLVRAMIEGNLPR